MVSAMIVRWTVRQKVQVLLRIELGEITDAEAMARWEISAEELAQWRQDYAHWGAPGLTATRKRPLVRRGDGSRGGAQI